jgi:hypothetical protein
LLDDTIEHNAGMAATGRVILLFELWRPERGLAGATFETAGAPARREGREGI